MEIQSATLGRSASSPAVSPSTSPSQVQRELGQFLTPRHIADLMASMFRSTSREVRLLDAGAGTGNLTDALVRRICAIEQKPKRVLVTAYELDASVIDTLRGTLEHCQQECQRVGVEFAAKIHNEDFVSSAVSILKGDLFSPERPLFNTAIVNPPYRKLRSDSSTRLLLRSIGIETSNFYAAFTALIARLLARNGELVAITPRSFCNGPYFLPFRSELLDTMSLRRLHLFESRSAAFGTDNVLQENIILHAVKEQSKPREVTISSSTGRANAVVKERVVPFSEVVSPDDPELFIHVRVNESQKNERLDNVQAKLSDLGLSVSTGRVVDFRAKSFLRRQASADTAPLIYPCHFNGGTVVWPKEGSRKPNALLVAEQTHDLLVPSAVYVLVKRFSSKEERRRIVASVYDPKRIIAKWVAFENHLNYFHVNGGGLSMALAKGLAAFLNSTVVDSCFREFSGHTQVNATDLRKLKYPTRSALEELGQKIRNPMGQTELDELLEAELF